jgi:hypothetical protein
VKVTFKDGTVIEDVTSQELPFVLAMSNPGAVAKKITERLASQVAPSLSWINTDHLLDQLNNLFRGNRDSASK